MVIMMITRVSAELTAESRRKAGFRDAQTMAAVLSQLVPRGGLGAVPLCQ